MAHKPGKIEDIQETLKDYNIRIKDIAVSDVFTRCLSKEDMTMAVYCLAGRNTKGINKKFL